MKRLLNQHDFGKQLLESGILFFRRLKPLHLWDCDAAKRLASGEKSGV